MDHGPAGKHSSDSHQHEACPFAAAPHVATPSDVAALQLPSLLPKFSPQLAGDRAGGHQGCHLHAAIPPRSPDLRSELIFATPTPSAGVRLLIPFGGSHESLITPWRARHRAPFGHRRSVRPGASRARRQYQAGNRHRHRRTHPGRPAQQDRKHHRRQGAGADQHRQYRGHAEIRALAGGAQTPLRRHPGSAWPPAPPASAPRPAT